MLMKSYLCSAKPVPITLTKHRIIVLAKCRVNAVAIATKFFTEDGLEFSTCVLLDADGNEEVVYQFNER